MHAIRRRLRSCTWLAVVAMTLLALGPTISRLTLPEAGTPLAPAGTAPHRTSHRGDALAMANGAAMPAGHTHHHHVPAGDDEPQLPAQPHPLEHCALCVVALFAFAVALSAPTLAAPLVAAATVALPRERGTFLGRDTWSPATSRGPPALG
jgi:hypothetical protein